MVSKRIPEYLRLHVEQILSGANSPAEPGVHGWQEFPDLCDAFREATGWSLRVESAGQPSEEASECDEPAGTCAFRLAAAEGPVGSALERSKAQRLAASLAQVLSELDRARDALWRREADLAASVPVTSNGRADEHLAERLEAVLKSGAQAVGCQAAGIYLLDDATTELKLRACWGLPKRRLLKAARPLRGAMADLEALLGHAVVLEDTSLLPQWRVPEPYAAAICVPIASSTEPLGTLWMFCDHPRDFSAEQSNLVEIIAGRIAAELQREVLLRECVHTKRIDRQLARAVQWQADRLPSVAPLLPGWEVAGWLGSDESLRGGFYDWFVPPDGQLAVAAVRAEGTIVEAALTAASLHGALRVLASEAHNCHDAVPCLNDAMWNSSAGGQVASCGYATIAPDSGAVECLCSGTVTGVVLARDKVLHIRAHHPPLGMQPSGQYVPFRCQLEPGEVLVLVAGGWFQGTDARQPTAQELNLVDQIASRPFTSLQDVLDHIKELATQAEADFPAAAVLAVRRKPV